jgi:hypothetical protein
MAYNFYDSDWITDWGTYTYHAGPFSLNTDHEGYVSTSIPPQHDWTDSELSAMWAQADAILYGPNPQPWTWPHWNYLRWYMGNFSQYGDAPATLEARSACTLNMMSSLWYPMSVAPSGWNQSYPIQTPKIGVYGAYNPGPNNDGSWWNNTSNPTSQWPNTLPEPMNRAWPTMTSPETGDTLEASGYTFQSNISTVLSAVANYGKYGAAWGFAGSHDPGWQETQFYGPRNVSLVAGHHDVNSPWKPQDSLGWTVIDSQTIDGTGYPYEPEVPAGIGSIDVTAMLDDTNTLHFTNLYAGSLLTGGYTKGQVDNIYHSVNVESTNWLFQYPPVQFHYYEWIEEPESATDMPPLRQYPRDDGLTGGQARIHPVPQSQQRGWNQVGYF